MPTVTGSLGTTSPAFRAASLNALWCALVRPWPPYSVSRVMPSSPASHSARRRRTARGSVRSGGYSDAWSSSHAFALARNASTSTVSAAELEQGDGDLVVEGLEEHLDRGIALEVVLADAGDLG